MHFKWNNAFSRALASSVAVLVAATNLYAIPQGPCDEKPEACCDEPRPGPFAFAFPMDMNLSCPKDFYVHADFIAFQAKQDGMEFAIQDSNGVGGTLLNGTFEGFSNGHKDWSYNYGARFGAGVYLDHDAWNADFTWTWLNISDYKHANATTGDGKVIPLYLFGKDTPTYQMSNRTSAVWDSSMNILDVTLGKPYHVSRYVVFSPFFGIRAGCIDQHFSVDYSGDQTFPGEATRTIHHGDNDFWGVGARTGLNSTWTVGKGWSLFGNVAGSILFGKFEINQKLHIPNTPDASFDLDNDHYMNVPNCEIAMGVAWGKYFDKQKYYVSLKAGYEFHVWFDQLNMRRFSSQGPWYANDVVSRGNLTLNGFSLAAQLDI